MKELADILAAYQHAKTAGVNMALATVVRVQGSAYRREGAKMLVTGEGRMVGGVSGGCLDRDVIQRAGTVMATGLPVLVRYDTALDPESGAGYTLGCGGAVDVLIESLNTPAGAELMGWLSASRSTRKVIATVISKHSPIARLGQRLQLDEAGTSHDGIGDEKLSATIREDLSNALRAERSTLGHYPHADGILDLFIEYIPPPLNLLIFGAGNDAVPLALFGRALGWHVTLVDVRSSPTDLGRTWDVDALVQCRVEEISHRVVTTSTTAAVVMTHNFAHDQRIIAWLAHQPLMYLGLLGARHRTQQLLADMRTKPVGLHSPVGLDLGGQTPEEVALAIAAEITAVLHGRPGSPLTKRSGPIHTATELLRSAHQTEDEPRESITCPIAAS